MVTDLTALISKYYVLLIILISSHVCVLDQNRKPEGSKSVPGTNGWFSLGSTKCPD